MENAVKYGVAKGHSPEHILIRTRALKDFTLVTVEDDGPGFFEGGSGDGIGLNNVKERLSMMCNGSLEISSRPGGGTSVTMRIPHDS